MGQHVYEVEIQGRSGALIERRHFLAASFIGAFRKAERALARDYPKCGFRVEGIRRTVPNLSE